MLLFVFDCCWLLVLHTGLIVVVVPKLCFYWLGFCGLFVGILFGFGGFAGLFGFTCTL